MADEEKSEETSAAEIRMIYQQHFDEFHFLKRQQWTVTYYTVLVYAALISSHHQLSGIALSWISSTHSEYPPLTRLTQTSVHHPDSQDGGADGPYLVESGCGAVAVGSAYRFPPLSSGGASIAGP